MLNVVPTLQRRIIRTDINVRYFAAWKKQGYSFDTLLSRDWSPEPNRENSPTNLHFIWDYLSAVAVSKFKNKVAVSKKYPVLKGRKIFKRIPRVLQCSIIQWAMHDEKQSHRFTSVFQLLDTLIHRTPWYWVQLGTKKTTVDDIRDFFKAISYTPPEYIGTNSIHPLAVDTYLNKIKIYHTRRKGMAMTRIMRALFVEASHKLTASEWARLFFPNKDYSSEFQKIIRLSKTLELPLKGRYEKFGNTIPEAVLELIEKGVRIRSAMERKLVPSKWTAFIPDYVQIPTAVSAPFLEDLMTAAWLPISPDSTKLLLGLTPFEYFDIYGSPSNLNVSTAIEDFIAYAFYNKIPITLNIVDLLDYWLRGEQFSREVLSVPYWGSRLSVEREVIAGAISRYI